MNQPPQPGQPGAGSGQPAQAASGAQAVAGQVRQPQLATSQMVDKITILQPEEKRKYQNVLDQLWASYNSLSPDSAEANGVRTRIAEISRSLMTRVQLARRQQVTAQQAQAQTGQQRTGTPQQAGGGLPTQNQGAGTANAAAAADGQQPPTGAGGNAPAAQANQIQRVPPHIAKHLNEITIIPPPQTPAQDVRKVQAELRKQYGMALMTMENMRNKIQQIDNVIKDRKAKGTLKPEESRAWEQHKEALQKAHDDARKSVENFRQQQEYLKAQNEKKTQGGAGAQGQTQAQQQAQGQQAQGQGDQAQAQGQMRPQQQAQNLSQAAGAPANGNANQQLQNPQTLTASVNTAVEAAKNQAPQMQQSSSQARPQPKPQPGGQPQQQVPGAKPDQPHPQPLNTQAAAGIAQQSQTGTPTQASVRVQTPQSATAASTGRPLSIQAAFHNANERNAQPGTPMANQPANSNLVASANGGATPSAVPSHGHPVVPQQTVQPFPSKMPISKQLPEKATQPPQPVAVSGGAGAGRPTYNGGTGTSGGVVSQPAVPRVPMYIHEAEGEHVLSKKKLDELVRQVCGGSAEGQEENLMAPEVEEVRCPSSIVLKITFGDSVLTGDAPNRTCSCWLISSWTMSSSRRVGTRRSAARKCSRFATCSSCLSACTIFAFPDSRRTSCAP